MVSMLKVAVVAMQKHRGLRRSYEKQQQEHRGLISLRLLKAAAPTGARAQEQEHRGSRRSYEKQQQGHRGLRRSYKSRSVFHWAV